MLAKVGSGQERHWGPPGLYLVALLRHLLAGRALRGHRRPGGLARPAQRRGGLPARLDRAGLASSSRRFPTKLPHYVLPLYPAIAILTARALDRRRHVAARAARRASQRRCCCRSSRSPCWSAARLCGNLARRTAAVRRVCRSSPCAASLALFAGSRLRRGRRRRRGARRASLAAVVASASASSACRTPMLRSLKLSPRLAEVARALGLPGPALCHRRLPRAEPRLPRRHRSRSCSTARARPPSSPPAPCRMTFVEAREEKAFARCRWRDAAPRRPW